MPSRDGLRRAKPAFARGGGWETRLRTRIEGGRRGAAGGGLSVALCGTLLALNATESGPCAFGIEGEAVVITDALQLENLDFNELQAVIDDISMAISKHYPALSKFRAAA